MIIQLPPGTSSIMLRFDGPAHGDAVTLLPAPAMPLPPARQPPVRPGFVTMCLALGAGLTIAGVAIWNNRPQAEATLNLPHPARWTSDTPRVPAALQAELNRVPTVIPPDAGPPAAAQPAASPAAERPAGTNPFGLE